MKYTGEHLNEEFCRAVGINPESVNRIVVDLAVGEVARVTTEGFVETDDGKIDRLKTVLRHYELKPKGGIELKNPFKRTKPDKPDQGDQPEPDGPANCRCFIVGVDAAQLTPPLDDLGLSFQVGYDDNRRGSPGAWYLAFTPSYSWKGQTFGVNGATVVKGIGLETDRGVQYGITDDGLITFYFQSRPTDVQIYAVVKATENQVAAIMKKYGETKAILECLKKK